jgi:guanine deaminase
VTGLKAFRGAVLHFTADPRIAGEEAHEFIADGLLVLRDGRVVGVGEASAMAAALPEATPLVDYRGKLILPGFIDLHVHCPQTEIIASPGRELLDWLRDYALPAEAAFSEPEHARDVAEFFLDQLLAHGTTSALVFSTVHASSADALFSAALARNMAIATGKVLMDRHCPDSLRDTPESGYADSRALIDRWHGKGRLRYAVTPRFAPTSSPAQMESVAALLAAAPGLYVQSHLAENRGEMDWVRALFPAHASYLDVYAHYGMLRPGAFLAHCIHLDPGERRRIAESGTTMVFCPTSNLFLGSGLFDWQASLASGAPVGIGTDVGGGTDFGLLRTLAEGYKVARLQGQTLDAFAGLHALTRGAATALGLAHEIGSFTPGAAGDFVVLDLAATPLMARRMRRVDSLREQLFVLMMLADDRAVAATYVMGDCRHLRAA